MYHFLIILHFKFLHFTPTYAFEVVYISHT